MSKNIFIVVLLISISISVNAQLIKDTNLKIGYGVYFNSQEELGLFPGIIIPISLGKKYKIEPEISFRNDNIQDAGDKKTINRNGLGIGIYRINNIDLFSLYYGIRVGYEKIYYYNEYENVYGSNKLRKNLHKYSPLIGCEYYFYSHCSIGCETIFSYIKEKEDNTHEYLLEYDRKTSSSNYENNIKTLEFRIIYRIYF